MECISARSISKSYKGRVAVDAVSVGVEKGSVYGFLGPNGAGKSTTIKMLTTLIRPDSGTIQILGMDALERPLDVRRRIGVVLQQPSYEPTLSVEKSLEKYGMMWEVPRKERSERAERLITDFGLGDFRHQRNQDLSIGQRRRVQVAREFMHDMDLLFLDEPTVGLDPSARRRLLDYLRDRTAAGLTIFYTTHILSEAEYLCDIISFINGGKITTTGPPDELRRRFGTGRTLSVRLSGATAILLDRISAMDGCSVAEDGTVAIRSNDTDAALRSLMGIAGAYGAKIDDVSAGTETLEDTFLRMVGDAPGA